MFLILSGNAHTMMKLKVKCPKLFVGTVTEVAKAEAPLFSKQALGRLKKVDVYFQVKETVRGNIKDTVMIQTLKNGPVVFQEGEQYEVEMRGNYICSAKPLNI